MEHLNLYPVTDIYATEEATRRSSRRSACRLVAPPVAGGDNCRSSWALACGWTARIICCTSWKSFSLWEFTTDLNSSRHHILWRSGLQTLDNKYPSAHSSAVSGQKIDSWLRIALSQCCEAVLLAHRGRFLRWSSEQPVRWTGECAHTRTFLQ